MSVSSGLRPLANDDLAMLLEWRNSDQIRNSMFSTNPISPDEHVRWFLSATEDPHRHLLIFQRDGVPAGFVNIGPVTRGGIAEWGFYAAPGAARGTGRALGAAALVFAFELLHLHKLCGAVIGCNEPSRRLHLALGFRQEGVLVDQHFDGSSYHDIVRFGLLNAEWKARQDGGKNAVNP